MKKIAILTLLGLVIFNCSFAQSSEKYSELIEEAEHFYEIKEYSKSGNKYNEAFLISENEPYYFADRYLAACSWALANEIDSAFKQLFIFAEVLFSNGNIQSFPISDLFAITDNNIIKDPPLNVLRTDYRWKEVLEILEENKIKTEAKLDMQLVWMLDTVYMDDQRVRDQISEIGTAYGWESEELKSVEKKMKEQDSLNLIKIEKILNERGWLGPDSIGYTGNLVLFLVIQHSTPEIREKYLPMMRDAAIKGNARAVDLGYVEDRNAMEQNRKQVYGSQLSIDPESGESFVWYLEDPDNVDKRRAEVGLNTMQEYISEWGLIWDIEEHKKRIIKFEASPDILQDSILDTIYKQDQNYRQQIDEIEQLYGSESEGMKANMKIMHENDSLNLIQIKNKVIDNWAAPSSPCFAEFKHPPEIKYKYKNKDAIFLLSRSYGTFRASDWEKDAEKYILKGYLLDDRRIKGYY